MVDNRGAGKPAPKTSVEQEIGYVGARLREKSTYAGLTIVVALLLPILSKYIPGLASANAGQIVNDISAIGIGIGGLIAIALPERGTVKTIIFLIAAGAALAFARPASAAVQHSHHRAAPLPKDDPRLAGLYDATKVPAGKPTVAQVQQNPLLLLQQIATADLQAALADAQAQNPPDTIAANCYQALINLKNNPAFALPSGAVPGLFTAIQKGRDLKTQLANLAAPNGPLANLNAACAAWNQDNLTTLVNIGIAVGLVSSPAGATAAVASLPAQIAAFLAAVPKL